MSSSPLAAGAGAAPAACGPSARDRGGGLQRNGRLAFRSVIGYAHAIRAGHSSDSLDHQRAGRPPPRGSGAAEPALNTEAPRALENLARLRVDGFGLALDDFGSGTLAVERLALVAFSHLRIGPTFVRNSDEDESAKAGLAVALDLPAQLRLHVIAGGISGEEEWRLLQAWGCHYGQGPGISPALQAHELLEWTRKWNSTGTLAQAPKKPTRRG